MRRIILIIGFLVVVQFVNGQQKIAFEGKTISFKSNDGVQVTADLYMAHKSDAPFIILFHKASYSRGEYR